MNATPAQTAANREITVTMPASAARVAAEELYATIRTSRENDEPAAYLTALEQAASVLHEAGWGRPAATITTPEPALEALDPETPEWITTASARFSSEHGTGDDS
jgi:hypothetical protein